MLIFTATFEHFKVNTSGTGHPSNLIPNSITELENK